MNHWTAPYVGIPSLDRGRTVSGVDCYGLVWLVFREVLLIDLPSYDSDYPSASSTETIGGLIAGARTEQTWCEQSEARPFDVLVFRRGRIDCHVGLVVSAGRMLHVAEGDASRIEPYDSGYWMPRLSGIYRHFKNVQGRA